MLVNKNLDYPMRHQGLYLVEQIRLNDHTNGLIRQYLPKSFAFKDVTDDEIQAIENKLNHRPRKMLQYKTLFEVFFAGTQSTTSVTPRC